MAPLKRLWVWLSDPAHQRTLGFFGAGTAAVAIGLWQVYLHFATSESAGSATFFADRGSVAAGRDVHFGISLKEHEASLKAREAEIRAQLESPALEEDKKAGLEAELSLVRAKRTDLERNLEAIAKGDTVAAVEVLKGIEETSSRQAAEAAYQQGLLAEQSREMARAAADFRRAARFEPENQTYREALRRLSPSVDSSPVDQELWLPLGPGPAQEKPLTTSEILNILGGNTAIYVNDGKIYRQYFNRDGTTTNVDPNGSSVTFKWAVTEDNRYKSWGYNNDPPAYFAMTGEGNHITWIRATDGYLSPGRVVIGRQLRRR